MKFLVLFLALLAAAIVAAKPDVFKPMKYKDAHEEECYMQYAVDDVLVTRGGVTTEKCIKKCLDNDAEYKEFCRRLVQKETVRKDACFVQAIPFDVQSGLNKPGSRMVSYDVNSAPECQGKCYNTRRCNFFIYFAQTSEAHPKNCEVFVKYNVPYVQPDKVDITSHTCRRCNGDENGLEFICGRYHPYVVSGPSQCTGDEDKKQSFLGDEHYYANCYLNATNKYHPSDWEDGFIEVLEEEEETTPQADVTEPPVKTVEVTKKPMTVGKKTLKTVWVTEKPTTKPAEKEETLRTVAVTEKPTAKPDEAKPTTKPLEAIGETKDEDDDDDMSVVTKPVDDDDEEAEEDARPCHYRCRRCRRRKSCRRRCGCRPRVSIEIN